MHSGAIAQDILDRCMARRGRIHTFETIDPARTAMLVIDLQEAFVAEGAVAEIPMARDIVPGINRINQSLREAGGLVVWIVSTYGPKPEDRWPIMYDHIFDAATGERIRAALSEGAASHAIYSLLDTRPEDPIVSKNRFSAFVGSDGRLEELLRSRGIDTVLVTGTVTSVCCESTAREAAMRNFKTLMVSDASAGRDDEEHWASLANILLGFGDVYTADETIALIKAGCDRESTAAE